MTEADPQAVKCSYCRAPAGERCGVRGFNKWRAQPAARPHKARTKLALVLAAHADPALDAFPGLGPVTPCGLCGSGLPQRHRIVDAIAGRLDGGETEGECAADYGLPAAAVGAVRAWASRWPGAW